VADFYKNQRKFLQFTGKQGVNRLKKELQKLGKVATGGTYNSVHSVEEFSEKRSSSSVFADEAIDFIDKGRRKGGKFPPPDVIEEWVRQRGIVFRQDNGKAMPVKVVAFLIGRKIARDGIEPTHVIDRVFNKKSYKELIKRRLSKASLEDIRVRTLTLSKKIQ